MSRMGIAVFGEMNNVISGTARMENPKPVRPCRAAEKKKIANPINTT